MNNYLFNRENPEVLITNFQVLIYLRRFFIFRNLKNQSKLKKNVCCLLKEMQRNNNYNLI